MSNTRMPVGSTHAWQIRLKPGEQPRSEEGRWLAHRIGADGHVINATSESFATRKEAEMAV